MSKRKKQHQQQEEEKITTISGDIKRSLVAIFLFMLGVLFLLGFAKSGGILGNFFDATVGKLFGWGKWLSPLVLFGAATVLLFRKETLFYVSKILGIFLAFGSFLGFIHLFYSADAALGVAKSGAGGGYLGYGIAALLSKMAGKIGGGVVLFSFLLMGLVLALDFPLVKFVKAFIARKIEESESDDEADDGEEEKLSTRRVEKLENPIIESKKDKKGEIKTQFVHGPEEEEKNPVSEEIIKKAIEWTAGKKPKRISSIKSSSINDIDEWDLPQATLLEKSSGKAQPGDIQKNVQIIQDTFKHFGIEVEPGDVQIGPTVTQYTFRPAVGVKLSRITSLSNDLALALAQHPIRIEAPIPGKSLIGIEVENKSKATVRLPEIFNTPEFENRQSNLLLALGKDVSGNLILADLKKMPHLLVAGSTNSGKSVCINAILLSLLYQNSPEELKLILVDPKRVELSLYNGIPHLLTDKVIVEKGKVVNALKWAISEMERRYKLLPETGSRDIMSYNQKAESGEIKKVVDPETGEVSEEPLEKLPYIVVVIDEMGDLMSSHGKEVEGAIIRLAQMARAVGIHLIVSTQRPEVSVITGLIKSNIPTRIAFKVATQIDSRTILDASGAEKLLGNGDMLFSSTSVGGIRRLQGALVTENEVKRVVDFIIKQGKERSDSIGEDITASGKEEENSAHKNSVDGKLDFDDSIDGEDGERHDPMFERAKSTVIDFGKASTSFLQRKLGIGYNRAARLIDMLEEEGIIGPSNGSKQREILVGSDGAPDYEDEMDDQQKRDKWQI